MPISSVALSRTHRNFTDHLKNFELGTITETNPSNGVYRYTFADGTSPNTWAEVANAAGGVFDTGYYLRFGMNVGHVQMNNNTNAGGGYDNFSADPNLLHVFQQEPKSDSLALVSGVQTLLPTGRNTETSGTFASFLGGTATTQGYNYANAWYPHDTRMTGNNATPSLSRTDRYVEINWNTVALNETTYTTGQRSYGRTLAGKVKLVFQPYVYFDTLGGTLTDYAVYYGKPRYYDTTIAGTNLVALKSSPPSDISTFSNSAGTRTFGWTETDANFANPYIYLWKWNGSTYVQVREGYISNGSVAWDTIGTKSANYNSYTVPSGDGGGYYYIYLYQYDGYYNTYSNNGTYSGDIFL